VGHAWRAPGVARPLAAHVHMYMHMCMYMSRSCVKSEKTNCICYLTPRLGSRLHQKQNDQNPLLQSTVYTAEVEAAGTDHPRVFRTGTPVSRGGRRVVELVGSFNGCARGGRHSIPDTFASAFGGHQSCIPQTATPLDTHARTPETRKRTQPAVT
jgi:hypothetical protein